MFVPLLVGWLSDIILQTMLETESKKRPIPALIAVKQEIDLSVESSSMPLPIETIPRPNFAQVSGESIG